MKFKVDNIGWGTCRVKAHIDLTRAGAQNIEFNVSTNIVKLNPGPLSERRVIEILESHTIRVEEKYSDKLILFVDLDDQAVAELSKVLGLFFVEFDQEAGKIIFDPSTDEYEVLEIIELYGYRVKKVERPF